MQQYRIFHELLSQMLSFALIFSFQADDTPTRSAAAIQIGHLFAQQSIQNNYIAAQNLLRKVFSAIISYFTMKLIFEAFRLFNL